MNHPSACICVFCKSCIPAMQDRTVNSSDWFSYIPFDITSENLGEHQDDILWLMGLFVLVSR